MKTRYFGVLSFWLLIAAMLSTPLHAQNTILEARGMTPGTVVTVKGIVTNGAEFGVIRYLQDNTAGIAVYGSLLNTVNMCDSVIITGTLKVYNQLLELDPLTSVVIKSSGNPLPTAIELTPSQISEPYESMLIKVNNALFTDAGGTFAGNTKYQFTSNGEIGYIYIKSNQTDIVGQLIPSGAVTLTAVLSQFDYSDPTAGYQMLPRTINDIQIASSSIPTRIGWWKFDDGADMLKANIGSALTLNGTQTSVPGPVAGNLAIEVAMGNYLIADHGIAPNGGGDSVNVYSLQFDILVPELGLWYAIFQTYQNNDQDASMFINTNNFLGAWRYGYSADTNVIEADTWYRIVVSVENGVSYNVYVNGEKWVQGVAQEIDSRDGLGQTILFFADNDGEDATIVCSEISIWDVALTAEQALELGDASPNSPVLLPLDFENGPYTFADWGNAVTTVIPNPQSIGINTSANVAQQIRNSGGATIAGSNIALDQKLDFTTNKLFIMKVFSPRTGIPIILKAENADHSLSYEVTAYTGLANNWEVIKFNFDGATSGIFNNLSIFFDFGIYGDGTANSTFLFDDIQLVPVPPKPTAIIKKASTAPIIDGQIDAVWNAAPQYNIDNNFRAEVATLGASGETYFKILWNSNGIYVLVNVNDDEWYPGYESGLAEWMSDKVEVYFDVNTVLKDGIGGGGGFGHYRFAPTPAANAINGTLIEDINGYNYAYNVPTDAAYIFELYVPFSKLVDKDGNIVLTSATIGFDVTVIDLETPETTRRRAVWANIGAIDESYMNMDDCGTMTFDEIGDIVYVSDIKVSSAGGATTIITDGGTLQMSAEIMPTNATDKTVSWSVINETGRASIDGNGLLTAKVDGTVTVVATAKDGSGISGSKQITISNQVVTLSDVNIIKNGRFATDGPIEYPWNFWSGNGGTASVVNGICTMVPGAEAEQWQLQVNQENLDIYNDTTYILTFTAWAAANRVFAVDFEDNIDHGYNRFGDSPDPDAVDGQSEWQIYLTTVPTVYKRTVTIKRLDATSTKKFYIMPSASIETVYIDDISVVSLGDLNLVNDANLFAGGSGSQADPYLISTPEHLNNVRFLLGIENAGTYFSQIANIDLGVYPWNDGEGWEPIGNANTQFYGKYNGNWNTITGLTINRPEMNYVGLFGWAIGSTFNNIRLENVSITGNQQVAALAAKLQDNGIISNCYSSGNVSGQMFPAGLVANLYFSSMIDNSYSSANVQMIGGASSHQQAGGLISRLINSSVDRCFSTGKVEGVGSWFGGLVGNVTENSSITNSYATGDVTGDAYVGGLVGSIQYSNTTNCYATGRVSQGGGGFAGDFVGGTVVNCYWNTETSAQQNSAAGEPRNTLQMIASSTFNGWAFGSTWSIVEGSTYPYLQWQVSPGSFNYPTAYIPPSNLTATPHNEYISLAWQAPSMGSVTGYKIYKDGIHYTTTSSTTFDDMGLPNYTYYTYYITADYSGNISESSNSVSTFAHSGFAGGDGSATNPYLISNAGELFTTRLYLSSNFIQIADIDLGVYPWNYNEGWQPIGNFSVPFTGTYNGDNFTIVNLTINRTSGEPVGLFGSTNNGALIENVILNYATINGANYVGTLTGDANNTALTNIVSTNANISGISYIGGISGGNWSTSIKKSYSSGTINATGSQIGGIAGVNYGTSLINSCYSAMNIYSNGIAIGGLSGTNEFASTISNSYSLSAVYGNEYVGGIVGWIDTSFVNNCYSIGYVSGNASVGGLVGALFNEASVTNSYWNTETSAQATSAGGEGRVTSEMIYPYSNTYLNWDFNYIWANDANLTINNGYPYLRMLDVDVPAVVTYDPETITSNSASIRGNVTSDGGLPVTARGMVWSTSPNPSIESNNGITINGNGTGEFLSTLSPLTQNQTYYVKAYATNSSGTGYGNEVNFTTLGGSGTITINGKTEVCTGERGVTYDIGDNIYTNINWIVTNGDIVSGIGTNTIVVNWKSTGNAGSVEVQAVNSSSVAVSANLSVTFVGSISFTPSIYIKGEGKANILICEQAGANSYQWFRDGDSIKTAEGKKQYFVARTDKGSYFVSVSTNSGCFAYSETVTVTNKKSVNLYPNPATQSTTMSYEAEVTGKATLKIVDVFGKTLKQWDWDKPNYQLQEDIPLDGLRKGVYMIEISVDGINKVNERLIIN